MTVTSEVTVTSTPTPAPTPQTTETREYVAPSEVTGIASSTTSRSVTGLTANTVYFYKVVNYKSSTCSSSSTVARNISSCTTPNISVNVGQSKVLTSNVKDSGEIQNVRFARTGTTYTISPVNSNGVTVDSAHPYTTTVML